jgi:hypothetical protein
MLRVSAFANPCLPEERCSIRAFLYAPRQDAKRNALDALLVKPELTDTTEGYDTNTRWKMEGIPQIVDFMVELSGIEPLASSLRTRRSPS